MVKKANKNCSPKKRHEFWEILEIPSIFFELPLAVRFCSGQTSPLGSQFVTAEPRVDINKDPLEKLQEWRSLGDFWWKESETSVALQIRIRMML